MPYAELLCSSNFTFQRGASHARELVHRAKELGYAAIAITDECTLAGIVRAYEAATRTDIQLIIGSYFRFPEGDRLLLLAPTQTAYTQLCELITHGRRRSTKGNYTLRRADFESSVGDAIGLWIPATPVEQEQARWFATVQLAARYLGFNHDLAQDSDRRLALLSHEGSELNIPLVAVGDVYYHIRERRRLHDVLTAIRLKTTVDQIGRRGLPNGEHHLRPLVTLRKLYPAELLNRTLEIAQRCTFSLKNLHYEYPRELVPEGLTATEHLRALTEEGIQLRWPQGIPALVRTQIERELALIQELQYEHFFITVADIVRFARSVGILCQGRGSAANSAVC